MLYSPRHEAYLLRPKNTNNPLGSTDKCAVRTGNAFAHSPTIDVHALRTGNTFAHSPNIDRLAGEGVRFTDAYTVSPVCSPSRTSILLGVMPPQHLQCVKCRPRTCCPASGSASVPAAGRASSVRLSQAQFDTVTTHWCPGVHVPVHGVYENGVTHHDDEDSLTPYFSVLKKQAGLTAFRRGVAAEGRQRLGLGADVRFQVGMGVMDY